MEGKEMEKRNKTKEVLKHLKEKGSITSWEAIQFYGATRLSAIIFNLRKRGYNIDSLMVEKMDRFGNESRYAKYILRED